MAISNSKIVWEKFENIRFYELFYSHAGRLMLKTGGNTAVSQTGSKQVYRFDHDEPVRRTEIKPIYKATLRH